MRNRDRLRSRAVVAIALFGLALACETTRAVGPAPSPGSIADINDASRGRALEVQYRAQALAPPPLGAARRSLFEADNTGIARADATHITFVKRDGSEQAIQSHLIRRVSVTNHARGALTGALIGGVTGAFIGVTAGVTDPGDQRFFSTEDVVLRVGLILGLVGALIGAGVGAAVGQRQTFVFDETP